MIHVETCPVRYEVGFTTKRVKTDCDEGMTHQDIHNTHGSEPYFLNLDVSGHYGQRRSNFWAYGRVVCQQMAAGDARNIYSSEIPDMKEPELTDPKGPTTQPSKSLVPKTVQGMISVYTYIYIHIQYKVSVPRVWYSNMVTYGYFLICIHICT